MKCGGTRIGAVDVANKVDVANDDERKVNSEQQSDSLNLCTTGTHLPAVDAASVKRQRYNDASPLAFFLLLFFSP